MKFFSSEFVHSYESYSFGYCNYCEREEGDEVSEIYERGYLPYSGSPDVVNTFYMARSARSELQDFSPTSENRRILKKFDGQFEKDKESLDDFRKDESAINLCLNYFRARHGEHVMPRARLKHILDSCLFDSVIRYQKDGKDAAFVFLVENETMAHFWFSFYDIDLIYQSLGMWLMLDCARDAKEQGQKYLYIGTVYGEKALYKTNFKPLEWWDGSEWSSDIKLLKNRARSENDRIVAVSDMWKSDKKFFK